MSNTQPERSQNQDDSFGPQRVLQWAMCHPGVLLLSSLAVGAVLAYRRNTDQQATTPSRVETEADIIDGDEPLFI